MAIVAGLPFLEAAAPVIGSVVAGLFGRKGAKDQNSAQMAQAQKQMDFQERMSSTAHQREVQDLRKAGLNPILSATGGAGASTPSGAQATIQNELEPGFASAMAVRNMFQDLKNKNADYELTVNTARKADQDAATSAAQERLLDTERQIREKDIPMADLKLAAWKIAGEQGAKLLEWLGAGNSASGLLNTLKSLGDIRR